MDSLREYVLGIVAAALLCGILIRLPQNSGSKDIIRMLCGVFMTIALTLPIVGRKGIRWEFILPEIEQQAQDISAEGTAAAENTRREFIKQRVQAYILSRAEELETEIQAEVTLGENCIPVSVTIAGSISPQNRSRLSQVIASELGIPKEQQEWIG